MAPLWDEFVPQWHTRVVNFARDSLHMRLNQMENVYGPLAQAAGPTSWEQQVVVAIWTMRANIPNEVVIN